MHGFSIWLDSRHHPHPFPTPPSLFLEAASASHPLPSFLFFPTASARILNSRSRSTSMSISSASSRSFLANCSNIDSIPLFGGGGDENEDEDEDEEELPSIYGGGEIEIEKIGNNCRRIRSMIAIEASLQTVWNILTDYERLADFIPGLAVSQLLEKRPNFARLFQIGQQKLAFGLNFNAKGIVDCYEKDLESLPFGQRRDIEFKMVEGDFLLFEGKWSIEQCNIERCEDGNSLVGEEFHTTLSYVVDVEPKLWLPVSLVEGRLCREIQANLSCIRAEAEKAKRGILPDN
ncbi:uncharacterized protein LOC114256976 isoform X1 [Camellia sinensis]|uniref:uncharacterized protein LOC114256976 isoform X1 n=1 Tax=Camellia sinensis TaxID=4442 RepID=UPI001036CACB|nr:uncharacterized protein LOC114256976 isoform X1 [Camellia sinensis]